MTKTWWFCYHCQTYHTADCSSWFSSKIYTQQDRVPISMPEAMLRLYATGTFDGKWKHESNNCTSCHGSGWIGHVRCPRCGGLAAKGALAEQRRRWQP